MKNILITLLSVCFGLTLFGEVRFVSEDAEQAWGLHASTMATVAGFDKEEVLDYMDERLGQDFQSNEVCTTLVNILDQVQVLSRQDKIDWVEKNHARLAAPMFYRLGLWYAQEGDYREALKWQQVAHLRVDLDAAKCSNKSVSGGKASLYALFASPTLDALHENTEHPALTKDQRDVVRDESMVRGYRWHLENPSRIKNPHYMAALGMGSFLDAFSEKPANPFISEKEFKQKEKEILARFAQLEKEFEGTQAI